MHIEVKSVETEEMKDWVSKTSGEVVKRRFQTGLLHSGDEVKRFKITLWRDDKPFPPGRYVLPDSAYTVNQFGDLALDRRAGLVPMMSGVHKVAGSL